MRPGEGIISLWPLAVLVIVVILSAFSITPTTRLAKTIPADFADLRVAGAANSALANQYWKTATGVIQWKYNRSEVLPEQVPSDFMLASYGGKALTAQEQAARLAYWAKLRDEWPRPNNWNTTYAFDLHWALRGIQTVSNEVLRFIHQT
jgi:hypothetical protein